MPRLTISLDDDLYAMARGHAVANHMSLSKAVADLLRRRVGGTGDEPGAGRAGDEDSYFDPVLGFQVSRTVRRLTEAEIAEALGDEDRRSEGDLRSSGRGASRG